MLLVKWLAVSLFACIAVNAAKIDCVATVNSIVSHINPDTHTLVSTNKSTDFTNTVSERTKELVPIVTEWMKKSSESKETHLERVSQYTGLTNLQTEMAKASVEARFNPEVVSRVIAELETRLNQEAGQPLNSKVVYDSASRTDRAHFEKAVESLAKDLKRKIVHIRPHSLLSFNERLFEKNSELGNLIFDDEFGIQPRTCGDGTHTVDGHLFQQLTDIFAMGPTNFDTLMKLSVAANYKLPGEESAGSMWRILYDSPGINNTNFMHPNGASQAICACSGRLPYR